MVIKKFIRYTIVGLLSILILALVYFALSNQWSGKEVEIIEITDPKTNDQGMVIQSPAFVNGGNIPSIYTCDGENISPPLSFSGIPDISSSLVLVVDDPDAPAGVWVHWLIWNIPAASKEIAPNEIPAKTIAGTTDFGTIGYGGPCPPNGTHRYRFKLYALDSIIDLDEGTDAIALDKAMSGHVIESAELVGLYTKK